VDGAKTPYSAKCYVIGIQFNWLEHLGGNYIHFKVACGLEI
jgi:hypothetical protein